MSISSTSNVNPVLREVDSLVLDLKRAKGVATEQGKAVFLIGAGCSHSAGIRVGSGVAQLAACRLASQYSNDEFTDTDPEKALEWLRANALIPADRTFDNMYAYIFEEHYKDPVEQQEIVRAVIHEGNGQINWIHLCLGELVRQRYIHTVLTTNFDQLVLEGIIRAGVIPVVADGVESLTRIKSRPTTPQVVHLHGSLHTYDTRNSGKAVRELSEDPATQQAIRSLLHDSTLFVVVGYAGGEEGIMELLNSALQMLPNKVIYWICYSPDPNSISEYAKNLLRGGNRFQIIGQDSDDFFAALMKGLTLGTPAWMKDPTRLIQDQAKTIAKVRNKEIDEESNRYRTRIQTLRECQENEDHTDKLLSNIRELRLSGRHAAALDLLKQLDNSKSPDVWLMRADSAYELTRHEPALNLLEETANALERALGLVDKRQNQSQWAKIQTKLGGVYQRIYQRTGRGEQLGRALRSLNQAIEVLSVDQRSKEWGEAQKALGAALYHVGSQENDLQKLEEAVRAFAVATEVFSREREPLKWASVQNNIGIALTEIGKLRKDFTKVEEGMAAIEAALEVMTQERDPIVWARMRTNLANALLAMGIEQKSLSLLKRAEEYYRANLAVLNRERVPLQWAKTQDNLGADLQAIAKLTNEKELYVAAVEAHRAALQVFTRDTTEQYWAMAMANLGEALQEIGQSEGSIIRLDEAANHFKMASDVFAKIGATKQVEQLQSQLNDIGALQDRLSGAGSNVADA